MEEEGQRRSEQRERKRDAGCEARSTQEKPTDHTVHPRATQPVESHQFGFPCASDKADVLLENVR